MLPEGWDVQVVLSDTPEREGLEPGLVTLLERSVRETLTGEAGRLADIATAGPGRVEVSLTITGDPGIVELNQRYLGCGEATDVLSFPMWDTEAGEGTGECFLLGDVIISADTARRQAAEYGRPFPEEMCRLVVHGTLHLLDYTDETGDAASLMHAKEDAVLASLGFDPAAPASPNG